MKKLNNSPHLDMSLHPGTLSRFRSYPSIFTLFITACLSEKRQIPVLWSLVWPDRISTARSTYRIRGVHAIHSNADTVICDSVCEHKNIFSPYRSQNLVTGLKMDEWKFVIYCFLISIYQYIMVITSYFYSLQVTNSKISKNVFHINIL